MNNGSYICLGIKSKSKSKQMEPFDMSASGFNSPSRILLLLLQLSFTFSQSNAFVISNNGNRGNQKQKQRCLILSFEMYFFQWPSYCSLQSIYLASTDKSDKRWTLQQCSLVLLDKSMLLQRDVFNYSVRCKMFTLSYFDFLI